MLSIRWDKTKIFLACVALGLEMLIGSYFLIYMNTLRASQSSRAAEARQELDTVRNDAGQLTQLRKQYEESRKAVAHLEPGIAPDQQAIYVPTLLNQLQALANRTGMVIDSMNPGVPKAPVNPAPPSPPTTNGGGASTPPPAPAAPVEMALPVGLTLRGTFPDLLAFIDGLKTFPKLIAIETLQVRPKSSGDLPAGMSPDLDINMEIDGTVLPLISGAPL